MSIDKDAVEQRLTTGILGQWYAVAKSVQVRSSKPHGVRALGRHLVLWRDTATTFSAWRITARIAARASRAAKSTRTTSPAAITV